LDESSSEEELQEEAEWIQRNYVNHLNTHLKEVRVCARSKRWWNQEIVENRRILGNLKRSRKKGETFQQHVKKARSILRKIIQHSNTKILQEFLQSATKDQVWQAL